MKENVVEGIKFMPCGNRLDSIRKSRITTTIRLCFSCAMAVLLLVSMVVSSPLRAAEAPDPRLVQIAADVAAGMDIAVIIQQAVDGGMSVVNAVEAVINAGADAGRVVYFAITANYPAESVVQGAMLAVSGMNLSAADFQAASSLIFSSAFQAGANQGQIISGAAKARVAQGVITNALVQANLTSAPVFGYSAPTPVGSTTSGWYIGGSIFFSRPASPSSP